jgi:hypothetical protein
VPVSLAPPGAQNGARGARYYQPRPSPSAQTVKHEELELMRRLQEMCEASDLILQFGPYKGTTLAQVAMNHPEYVRQLMTRAQWPEVRAAAGRLVEALDAAAEHQRKSARGASRRGRSASDRTHVLKRLAAGFRRRRRTSEAAEIAADE